MATYESIKNLAGSEPLYVRRLEDGAVIPLFDEGNADCRDFLAWVAAGNTPTPIPVEEVEITNQDGTLSTMEVPA